MRQEPKRILEREYHEGKLLSREYLARLETLESRGQTEPGEYLLAAKDAYCQDHISYDDFSPIAVTYELELGKCLYGFPRRDTPFEPRLDILTSWYLMKTLSGDTDILIQENRHIGTTVWIEPNPGNRYIGIDVRPEGIVTRVQDCIGPRKANALICTVLNLDICDTSPDEIAQLWRIQPTTALQNILRYELENQ